MKGVSEMTARILSKYAIIAHKPSAVVRNVVSKPKDTTDTMDKKNVVYQVQCNNCSCNYVGQTGRKLATRLHEHYLAVRRHDQLSLLSLHQDRFDHHFDLQNAKVLAYSDTRYGREFQEAWYSDQRSINRHVDLDHVYNLLINKQYAEREKRKRRST